MSSPLEQYRSPQNKSVNSKQREQVTKNVSNPSPSTQGIGNLIADGMNSVGHAVDTSIRTVSGTIDTIFSGAVDSVFTRGTSRIPDKNNRVNRNLEPVSQVISSNRVKDLKKEVLTYPADIGKYYLLLPFAQYRRPNGFEDAELKTVETIALPMPDNLLEQYNTRWNSEDPGIYGEISANIEKTTVCCCAR